MPKYQMIAPNVPNMPWQDKPENEVLAGPLWRYSENPIIDRNPIPGVARIFNSAVMPYEGAFIGVFRGEQTDGIPHIYLGRSQDGIHWDFEKDKIPFVDEEGNSFISAYAYDPRLVKVEDTYYIMTKNKPVDAILNSFYRKCTVGSIHTVFDVRKTELKRVDVYDLCLVISNLCENVSANITLTDRLW